MQEKLSTNLTASVLPKSFKANDLIDEKSAAEMLDVSSGTLAVWRCTKRYKIPYIKIGRNVRYSQIALQEWIDSRTHDAEEK